MFDFSFCRETSELVRIYFSLQMVIYEFQNELNSFPSAISVSKLTKSNTGIVIFSLFQKTKIILYFGTFQIDLKSVHHRGGKKGLCLCVSKATHRDSGVSIFSRSPSSRSGRRRS